MADIRAIRVRRAVYRTVVRKMLFGKRNKPRPYPIVKSIKYQQRKTKKEKRKRKTEISNLNSIVFNRFSLSLSPCLSAIRLPEQHNQPEQLRPSNAWVRWSSPALPRPSGTINWSTQSTIKGLFKDQRQKIRCRDAHAAIQCIWEHAQKTESRDTRNKIVYRATIIINIIKKRQ